MRPLICRGPHPTRQELTASASQPPQSEQAFSWEPIFLPAASAAGRGVGLCQLSRNASSRPGADRLLPAGRLMGIEKNTKAGKHIGTVVGVLLITAGIVTGFYGVSSGATV